MSERILRALMELFALMVKQDGGIIEEERNYVLNFLEKQLTTNVLIRYLLLLKNSPNRPMRSTITLTAVRRQSRET